MNNIAERNTILTSNIQSAQTGRVYVPRWQSTSWYPSVRLSVAIPRNAQIVSRDFWAYDVKYPNGEVVIQILAYSWEVGLDITCTVRQHVRTGRYAAALHFKTKVHCSREAQLVIQFTMPNVVSIMSNPQDHNITGEFKEITPAGIIPPKTETQARIYEIQLADEVRTRAAAEGKPERLWLGMTEHKEYPPGYRHAWGNAWVSSTEDGQNPYPVASLRFRVAMPEPGNGMNTSDQTSSNASSCPGDCKYWGAAFGDFNSSWNAWASEPFYGNWSVSDNW